MVPPFYLMKKVFYILLTAFIIYETNVSCSNEYSSPLKGQQLNDIVLGASSNREIVSIGTGDLSNCGIASNEAWCKSSIQGSTVIINVDSNDTFEERRATITLTDLEDGTTLSFHVIQRQNNVIFTENKTYEIPEEGGEININVQSNLDYSVYFYPDASWLSQIQENASTRGLSSSTLTLKAGYNNSGDERTGTIALTNTDSGYSILFTVTQSLTPVVRFEKEVFTADELGGEIDVEVKSNIPLEATCSDTWISTKEIIEKDGFDFTQKLKVTELPKSQTNRETTIVFSTKDGSKVNYTKTISVKQKKSLIITDSRDKIYVNANYPFKIRNNTGRSVVWESSNTSVATVDNNGNVWGISPGTATIRVLTEDGKYSDEKTVVVVDLTSELKYEWGSSAIIVGLWKQTTISCQLYNMSEMPINITNCTIYTDGTYEKTNIDDSLWGILNPGNYKSVSIQNLTNATRLYVVWEYTFSGKPYTYRCDCYSFF